MTSAPSLPQKLIYSTDLNFYIEELRAAYNGKRLITSDGYEISFYLNNDYACEHVICGKGKKNVNYGRALRIPYIEYILLNESVRVIRLNKKTGNICFVSRVCSSVVICSIVRNKELKFITFYNDGSKNKTGIDSFDDRSCYREL